MDRDGITAAGVIGASSAANFGAKYRTDEEYLFVVNYDRPFLTHRATWAIALGAAGGKCTVIAPDTGYRSWIEKEGITFRPLELARENTGFVQAATNGARLAGSILASKARTVFLIQTAAYTLGAIVAPLAWRKKFIRVAGGIGTALQPGQPPLKSKILRVFLRVSSAFPNVYTLFQTESDRDYFISHRLARPERSWLIPGTGVDVESWRPEPSVDATERIVLFASRLTDEKGIREFVAMAEAIDHPGVRFRVVGEPDRGNKSHISDEELTNWARIGRVEFLGHREDMPHVFASSWLLVFPSKHPEGTPKTLIEAAACALPAVVSDQPGCRAVVDDGVTGWIAPDLSPKSLATQVERLLSDPELVAEASREARERAMEMFSLESVLAKLFAELGLKEDRHLSSTSALRVGASGVVQANTGIGVIQRQLYPRLKAHGIELLLSSNRDLGKGVLRSIVGLIRGFIPARGGATYLAVVPPLPVGVRGPLVSFVHDLRWLTTRSGLGRRYRAWDLHRTVRRSHHLLCVSERTRQDLVAFDKRARDKASVIWLGPGLMEGVSFDEAVRKTEPGLALLVGGAAHKRNEFAADVIAALPTSTIERIACVGVTDDVISTLTASRGAECVEIHGRVDDAVMVELFSRAEYFILLGGHEGFGLPYIEALSAGCLVIAKDQPLTRELMDGAAIFVGEGSAGELAVSILASVRPSAEARRSCASRFDWDKVSDEVAAQLRSSIPSLDG